jgi:hypothetical protein
MNRAFAFADTIRTASAAARYYYSREAGRS